MEAETNNASAPVSARARKSIRPSLSPSTTVSSEVDSVRIPPPSAPVPPLISSSERSPPPHLLSYLLFLLLLIPFVSSYSDSCSVGVVLSGSFSVSVFVSSSNPLKSKKVSKTFKSVAEKPSSIFFGNGSFSVFQIVFDVYKFVVFCVKFFTIFCRYCNSSFFFIQCSILIKYFLL